MLGRNIDRRVSEALADSPVVLLQGARQTGKTTLARARTERSKEIRYLTLDDAAVLAASRNDPAGFVAGLDGPVVLDEVQLAPELFPAIKIAVDRKREPGRFLLTGSANVLMLPKLSESLAGRMELLTLWPFSQDELGETVEDFPSRLLASKSPRWSTHQPSPKNDLWRKVLVGGFPEAQGRVNEERRNAWFRSYVTTILQRDVRELANIDALSTLPRILELMAARTGGLVNYSELSRTLSVPNSSMRRYFALLEAAFLVRTLPAWSTNFGKRLVKSAKIFLIDTGLVTALTGMTKPRLLREPTLAGGLLENFVVMELTKQAGWSAVAPKLFHFRTQAGKEVDLLLEDRSGHIAGVEVKASATVGPSDFRGLRYLRETVGDRFRRGVVLYTGTEVVPFGKNLHALPISLLWNSG